MPQGPRNPRSPVDPERLPAAVAAAWPPGDWRDVNVLVALSGGADSAALVLALGELKRAAGGRGRLIAAHFNHRLRGGSSNADEQWVRELCQSLGVPLEVGHARSSVDAEERTSEEAARDARYAFLLQAAERRGVRYVATAHTHDDQVETVLFRLFRGTGLAGLAGIRSTRELSPVITAIRPMLRLSRDEVEWFLAGRKQAYRVDSTNADTRYARNWLRHELLPLLRQRFGDRAGDAVAGAAGQVAEAQQLIESLAAPVALRAITPVFENLWDERPMGVNGPRLTIDTEAFYSSSPVVVREACKQLWRHAGWPEQAMGQREWQRLADYVTGIAETPPIMLPGGVRVGWADDNIVLEQVS